jgi:hypothetical protein
MRNISTLILTRFDRITHRIRTGKLASRILAPKAFILDEYFFKILALLFDMGSMFLIPTRRKSVYFILLKNDYIMMWAK